ncbi:MAG: phage head closure protein [Steroidobacteraceae bacterium]
MTLRTGGVQAGTLNRLCAIQDTVVAAGKTTWVDIYPKVPCKVLPLTASETVTTMGPTNVQAIQLEFRYRKGIRPRMRIILRNRILEIYSVINQDEKDRLMTVMCREAPV